MVSAVESTDFVEHLPPGGVVAVSGGMYEREIIGAIGIARAQGRPLRLIPLSPRQIQWAMELGIPTVKGYPTYFILQAEYRGPDYLLQSSTDSVFADRVMARFSEHLWSFVTDKRRELLVEVVPHFLEYTLDELGLYGDVVRHWRNYLGHVLVLLDPKDEDFFYLANALREIPGVIDAGVYLEPPELVKEFV